MHYSTKYNEVNTFQASSPSFPSSPVRVVVLPQRRDRRQRPLHGHLVVGAVEVVGGEGGEVRRAVAAEVPVVAEGQAMQQAIAAATRMRTEKNNNQG